MVTGAASSLLWVTVPMKPALHIDDVLAGISIAVRVALVLFLAKTRFLASTVARGDFFGW